METRKIDRILIIERIFRCDRSNPHHSSPVHNPETQSIRKIKNKKLESSKTTLIESLFLTLDCSPPCNQKRTKICDSGEDATEEGDAFDAEKSYRRRRWDWCGGWDRQWGTDRRPAENTKTRLFEDGEHEERKEEKKEREEKKKYKSHFLLKLTRVFENPFLSVSQIALLRIDNCLFISFSFN